MLCVALPKGIFATACTRSKATYVVFGHCCITTETGRLFLSSPYTSGQRLSPVSLTTALGLEVDQARLTLVCSGISTTSNRFQTGECHYYIDHADHILYLHQNPDIFDKSSISNPLPSTFELPSSLEGLRPVTGRTVELRRSTRVARSHYPRPNLSEFVA